MKNLEGKRILFIGTNFFNYHLSIKKELELKGAIVDFFNETDDCTLRKFYRFFSKTLLLKFDTKHHNKILNFIQDKKYDYLFVLHGEGISENFLSKIKSLNRNIISIMYQWDSIIHYNYVHLIPLFNKVFTFDNVDADKYKINFLPLFYIHDYSIQEDINHSKYYYDISFIGSLHSDRYQIIKNIVNYSHLNQLIFFNHLYISKVSYYKQKYLHCKMYLTKYLKFNSLEKSKVLDVIQKSNCIIDINENGQNGLTIRTFEMMAQNKKIITSNQNIKNYDFYDENLIYVFDRKLCNLDYDFIKQKTNKKYKNLEKYSISNWIKSIFINE